MPSCLGICVEKNLIKYAKLTKDKSNNMTTLNSFGIKFYDSLADTVREVIDETQSENEPICVGLNAEDYTTVDVFSGLSAKDMKSLIATSFNSVCAEKNVNPAALDMRFKLVRNTGTQDTYKAICIAAQNTELSNYSKIFANYKMTGILSVGLSASYLFKNKGISERMAVINIEDDTKITVYNNGEISELITIPIGMDEVFSRLADKYNSYARAYEACKGVNAYAEADLSLDEDSKEINDVLLPVLYDLKQRIVSALEEYKTVLRNVYITGTGVIINNIDLYLQDAFGNTSCEILVPYFINKDRNNLKEVLEVNNALAVAAYGLDGIDKETDFFASNSYMRAEANKNKLKKEISFKEMLANAGNWLTELDGKMKRQKKSKNRRASVAFDNEVEQLDQLGGAGESAKTPEEEQYYDPFEEWLCRVAVSTGIAFLAYTGVSHYTGVLLREKITLANQRAAAVEQEIKAVGDDIAYITTQAADYKTKTDKLTRILETIKTKEERSFDVPNFLSRLMFSVPDEVKVTSLKVSADDAVSISAESGRYSQLGYFVSRLKLEGVLEDVSMKVMSMDSSSIKIIISGVLP